MTYGRLMLRNNRFTLKIALGESDWACHTAVAALPLLWAIILAVTVQPGCNGRARDILVTMDLRKDFTAMHDSCHTVSGLVRGPRFASVFVVCKFACAQPFIAARGGPKVLLQDHLSGAWHFPALFLQA